MTLLELFNHTSPISARIGAHTYEVQRRVGGRDILFIAISSPDEEDSWRLDFAEHLDADVDEPFVNTKTGKGKEFEVFSFVVACAKDFVRIKDPHVIQLRSNKTEPNRAKLYAHLARKFGAEYEITQKETSRQNITVLTKKSP